MRSEFFVVFALLIQKSVQSDCTERVKTLTEGLENFRSDLNSGVKSASLAFDSESYKGICRTGLTKDEVQKLWELANAPSEPAYRVESLTRTKEFLQKILVHNTMTPSPKNMPWNVCKRYNIPQVVKVEGAKSKKGYENKQSDYLLMYLGQAIKCSNLAKEVENGFPNPGKDCSEKFALFVLYGLESLNRHSASEGISAALNPGDYPGTEDLDSKIGFTKTCDWPFSYKVKPSVDPRITQKRVFSSMTEAHLNGIFAALDKLEAPQRVEAAEDILKLMPSFQQKQGMPHLELTDVLKVKFPQTKEYTENLCDYRPKSIKEEIGAAVLVRHLEGIIACNGKAGETQTEESSTPPTSEHEKAVVKAAETADSNSASSQLPTGESTTEAGRPAPNEGAEAATPLKRSSHFAAEKCAEPVFSAIAYTLEKVTSKNVGWFDELNPEKWDEKQKSANIREKSNFSNQIVAGIKENLISCKANEESAVYAFVSRDTANMISSQLIKVASEESDKKAANSKQYAISLHILAAIPEQTKVIARYLINTLYSSDFKVAKVTDKTSTCDNASPALSWFEDTVFGSNYLVPLYLFLLSRYKCISRVKQEYIDHLTNALTKDEMRNRVVTDFIHPLSKIPEEDRDVADPDAVLEILSRMYSFEKNLNEYFNSVSLAGITAGETAIRVQLQASLAELALRALDQYAKIEEMEKDAKEKLHATWEVMKKYVISDE